MSQNNNSSRKTFLLILTMIALITGVGALALYFLSSSQNNTFNLHPATIQNAITSGPGCNSGQASNTSGSHVYKLKVQGIGTNDSKTLYCVSNIYNSGQTINVYASSSSLAGDQAYLTRSAISSDNDVILAAGIGALIVGTTCYIFWRRL